MILFLRNLYKKHKEQILYLVFGAITTVVNILSFYICEQCNMQVVLSNIIAWFLSVLFAFITNKIFVFESKNKNIKNVIKEIGLFLGSRISTGVLDTVFVWLFCSVIGLNSIVVKSISNIVVIILNYFCSKLFVFKK